MHRAWHPHRAVTWGGVGDTQERADAQRAGGGDRSHPYQYGAQVKILRSVGHQTLGVWRVLAETLVVSWAGGHRCSKRRLHCAFVGVLSEALGPDRWGEDVQNSTFAISVMKFLRGGGGPGFLHLEREEELHRSSGCGGGGRSVSGVCVSGHWLLKWQPTAVFSVIFFVPNILCGAF